MWRWLALAVAPRIAHELEVTKELLRDAVNQNKAYERMIADYLQRKGTPMSEDNETMSGNVVGGAVETVARQVEGAAVEATEFASDNVLGRLLGYVRAAKAIAEGGLQGALDVEKATTDAILKELDELSHTTKQAVRDAASGR
jgi:argininosuccinate lyase